MHATRPLENREWLNRPELRLVLDVLNGGGFEARVVGGAVRNALMGLPPGDLDIATNAHPDEVVRRAAQAGIKCVPTGIEHGTVTLVVQGHPFEVTTLREDVETFGRKAKVAFGHDWAKDAERRDFTINALSVTRDGIIHDYVGGFDDIAAARVRFIGSAGQRIAEDYLRILRFFRFHAAYGTGAFDAAGLTACIESRAGLSQLSGERVRAEMFKLLVTKGAAHAVEVMADTGLLLILLGGVALPRALKGMIHAENTLGLAPDPVRRLAALSLFVREDAERLAGKWRLSNTEARRLDSMARRFWRVIELANGDDNGQAFRARLYRLGAARFRDRILMAWAHSGGDAADGTGTGANMGIGAARWRDLYEIPDCAPVPVFPLRAADFIARGFAPGPALGDVMAMAENDWIEAGFPLAADKVAAIADRAAAAFTHDHRL